MKRKEKFGKKTKDWITIIQSIVIIISALVAGLWFILREEAEPKANISHEISYVDLDKDYTWVSFWITIENKGSRSVTIKNGLIKVRQIIPIESIDIKNEVIKMTKLNDMNINYEEDIKKEQVPYKVNWPIIRNYTIYNIKWTLGTGEKERLRYEFVISSKIDTIRIYTHFYDDDPNKGWRETTLYIITHKGDGK